MNGERRIARTRLQSSASNDHRRQHRRAQNHERGLDAPTLPGDDHVARTVGEQRHAERQRADQDQKESNADHCEAGLSSAASASAAMRRLAAMAASRASAFLTQVAASGARCIRQSGNFGKRGGDIDARSLDIDPRDHRDGSSPGGASIGVMRTSFCALASSRPRNELSLGAAPDACSKDGREHGELVRKRRGVRYAVGGERFERRRRVLRRRRALSPPPARLDTARRARPRRAAPRRRQSTVPRGRPRSTSAARRR